MNSAQVEREEQGWATVQEGYGGGGGITGAELQKAHAAAMVDVAKANRDGVKIGSKLYTTVAARVEAFRKHFSVHGRLRIAEAKISDDVVRMRALVELRDEHGWFEVASGYAEERRDANNINKTSAVEVCETSAIGRALANFGLHGGEYASANEVQGAKVKREEHYPPRPEGATVPPPPPPGHDALAYVSAGKHKGKRWADVATDYLDWCVNSKGKAPLDLVAGAKAELALRASLVQDDYETDLPPAFYGDEAPPT